MLTTMMLCGCVVLATRTHAQTLAHGHTLAHTVSLSLALSACDWFKGGGGKGATARIRSVWYRQGAAAANGDLDGSRSQGQPSANAR